MKQASSIHSRAWNVEYDLTETKLTGSGDILFTACVAKVSKLCGLLETELNGTL